MGVISKSTKKSEVSPTRLKGTSSALSIKHPVPNGLGSFVSAKGSILDDKDKSMNPQIALNVKSVPYGKHDITPTPKMIKIPAKLRLKSNPKQQPSVPIHIRSMSDVRTDLSTTNAVNITKGLQQTLKKDGKRIIGVTTPTSSAMPSGFHFAKDEKMKEYKKAITVAAAINSMRIKATPSPVLMDAMPVMSTNKSITLRTQSFVCIQQ